MISFHQCILDKCETSLGININETLNNLMIIKYVKLYFESGDMRISNDCSCIKKVMYVQVYSVQFYSV